MAIKQTRIFANHDEPINWAETLIGRVVRPLVVEFKNSLHSFWFSRYVCQIGVPGEDCGDCDFNVIPNNFKQTIPGFVQPGHRSMRFRFEVADSNQVDFEIRLQQLVLQHSYAISDVRDFDKLADLGGNRFLGAENRLPANATQRAQLVTHFLQSISELFIDALVGPDPENRFRLEYNNELQQNPNGSTFESLHHLFCNMTQVPVSILVSTGDQANLLGTFWGSPRGHRQIDRGGQLVNEVYLPY